MAVPLRVQLEPRSIDVTPGESFSLTVDIFNASEIIEAYDITILGLDPEWVSCEPAQTSLFPDVEGTVTVTVDLPRSFPAGRRELDVKVEPHARHDEPWIGKIAIDVAPFDDAVLVIEPATVTAGSTAKFTAKVSNQGNRPLAVELAAMDAEQLVESRFSPNPLEVAPGTVGASTLTATAKRPWLGPVTPRVLTVTGAGPGPPLQGIGTFLQRARIPRGVLTLLSILLALGAWALLLLYGIEKIVPDSATSTTVAEAPAGSVRGSASGPTGPLVGAVVEVFSPDSLKDPAMPGDPAGTAVAGEFGGWKVESLDDGPYFVRLTNPRSEQVIWWPGAPSAATGGIVLVPVVDPADPTPPEEQAAVEISGVVFGQTRDVTGIVLDDTGRGRQGVVVEAFDVDPTEEGAEPKLVARDSFVNGGGAFALDDLAVPGEYFVRFAALPFRDEVVRLQLSSTGVVGPDECMVVSTVVDCVVTIVPGDGVITGVVDDGSNPLAGAAVRVTNGLGQSLTMTTDADGRYLFEGLNTPDTYKLSTAVEGFQAAAATVMLMPDTPVDDLGFQLAGRPGTIAGSVWGPKGAVGEVMVTAESATGMGMTVTNTEGEAIGRFTITDLPTPGVYTLTFSKEGLEEVILIVELPPGGSVIDISVEPAVDLEAAIAAGEAEPASVSGTVVDASGAGIGEVAIEISDGDNMLATMTTEDGLFAVTGIEVDGSYTVTFTKDRYKTVVLLIDIAVGEQKNLGDVEMGFTDPIPVEELRLRTDGLGPLEFGLDGDVVADRLELAFAVEGITRNDPVPTFVAGDLGTCVDQDVEFIRYGTLIVINVIEDGDKRFAAYSLGDTAEDPTTPSPPGDKMKTLSGLRIGHRLKKAQSIYAAPVFEVNTFGSGTTLTYQVLRVSDGKLLLYGRLLEDPDDGVPGPSDDDRILTIKSPNACNEG